MIRGPRFGLGTWRHCCRWILLLVALSAALLPLFVVDWTQSTSSGGGGGRAANESAAAAAPIVRHSRNVRNDESDVVAAKSSSSSSSSSLSTPVHHRRKYGKTALHDHVGANVAVNAVEEGSILRLLSKNNLYIQSFPNGSVSATGHDSSYYSVLTQIAVGFGRIYIRGVASRLYLCINECGRLYGSETLDENCILRDQMEGNWYNTYTSIKYSTPDKSLFVAFSVSGSPCRLRLGRETASDGRNVVALGSHEKYALLFPVRNVSLPDGMNLTSLMQLNKRLSFARNTGQTTGCAPRCSKALDHQNQQNNQQNNQHNNEPKQVNSRGADKKKASNKKKCRCSATNGNKCQRTRHCQQTAVAEAGRNGTRRAGQRKKSPRVTSHAPAKKRKAPKRSHPMDYSLRFTHRNGEGRLIRHVYNKIRARPELADQLVALL